MRCDNIFCVYWEDECCILDEISIDIIGNCMDCIYVDIEEDILQAARERAFQD